MTKLGTDTALIGLYLDLFKVQSVFYSFDLQYIEWRHFEKSLYHP